MDPGLPIINEYKRETAKIMNSKIVVIVKCILLRIEILMICAMYFLWREGDGYGLGLGLAC